MLQAKKPFSVPQVPLTKQRRQPFYQTVGDRLQEHLRLIALLAGVVLVLAFGIGGMLIYRGYQKSMGVQELQKGIAMLGAGKRDEALALLEKAEQRLTGEARLLALFFQGQALSEQKQPGTDAERQAYEKLIAQAGSESFIRQLALMRLGQEAERNQNASLAQRFYQQAANINGPIQGIAMLAHARVLEGTKEGETAQALYEDFLQNYADSPLAEIVEQKKAE